MDTRPYILSNEDMSPLDKRIIQALRIDGRRSFRSLAHELGIAQRQIRHRVTELLDAGIVAITVVGNPSVLGYRATAIVALKTDGRRPLPDVALEVAEVASVDYVNVTSGRFDIFAQLVARDLEGLRRQLESEILLIDGVVNSELFPYRYLHFYEALSDRPSALVSQEKASGDLTIDGLDEKIITELSADGRIPLSEIADKVATSETQIRRRLKRLTDAHAIRVVGVVNPVTAGYRTIARLGVKVSAGHRVSDVADALAAIPAIAYIAVCIGRYDMFCELVCVDIDELDAVLDNQIQLTKGVERCEAFLHIAPLLYRPMRPRRNSHS
ncbi:Lrp/AsnC family transcriptional regulator [Nocardia pseudovaccinii]|uniref:Lrp/AsnC family transcriptional regulator n=1 Tax=Nocardia pseudovaccinii TaxID=189540 RepID=UPI003D91F47A